MKMSKIYYESNQIRYYIYYISPGKGIECNIM